ncbi:hypothetical protein V6N12_051242 [Hibiscus sabdariffa]|uniref:Uncharacterized protein n=1 Tax=Hibiscus sabdariffa TaxID=183260 RepID=A0ABR2GET4_9ROSI
MPRHLHHLILPSTLPQTLHYSSSVQRGAPVPQVEAPTVKSNSNFEEGGLLDFGHWPLALLSPFNLINDLCFGTCRLQQHQSPTVDFYALKSLHWNLENSTKICSSGSAHLFPFLHFPLLLLPSSV